MKKVLVATGVAVLAIATVAAAQGYVFSTNLTVGSTGPAVVALQTALISAGYNIPAIASGAAAKGYFGAQTQSAVKAYQSAHGVPNTGFVGPLTRAALNGGTTAMTTTTTTSACPAGYVCTPVAGNTTTTTTSSNASAAGITTPGVPGIMTVAAGPLSSSVLNVGQSMAPIITVRVTAQYSDLDVQSITLDLGNNTGFYNKLFNTIYVTDGTNVLASQAVNGSTAVLSGSEYLLGISGFHFIVPKGQYKDLVIKGTLNSSVDSAYISGTKKPTIANGLQNSFNGTGVDGWLVGVLANNVRAVDGAGLNLYGPGTGFYQGLTINSSLTDNAQANLSVDANSPLTSSIPVTDTTNGQYLGLPVLVFDVYAQNDTLHFRTVNINFSSNGTGSIGAAYLYQGATQVASASVSGNSATFSNISNGTNGATIPVNTTVPYTVKVDVTGISSGSLNVTASTSATQTILSSNDSTATVSGSAQGNTVTVLGVGPAFALTAAPSITTQGTNNTGSTISTSTIIASFPLDIHAVGSDVYFGTTASSAPAFLFQVLNSAGTQVYKGYAGADASTILANTGNLNNVKTVLPTLPTSVTNGVSQANTFKVANQNDVNLGTIQFQFDGKDKTGAVLTGGPYKVNLMAIQYATATGYATSTFMNGLSTWTTPGQNP